MAKVAEDLHQTIGRSELIEHSHETEQKEDVTGKGKEKQQEETKEHEKEQEKSSGKTYQEQEQEREKEKENEIVAKPIVLQRKPKVSFSVEKFTRFALFCLLSLFCYVWLAKGPLKEFLVESFDGAPLVRIQRKNERKEKERKRKRKEREERKEEEKLKEKKKKKEKKKRKKKSSNFLSSNQPLLGVFVATEIGLIIFQQIFKEKGKSGPFGSIGYLFTMASSLVDDFCVFFVSFCLYIFVLE